MKLAPLTFRLNIIELCEREASSDDIVEYIRKSTMFVKRTPTNLEILASELRAAGRIYGMYLDNKEEFYKLKEYLLNEEDKYNGN